MSPAAFFKVPPFFYYFFDISAAAAQKSLAIYLLGERFSVKFDTIKFSAVRVQTEQFSSHRFRVPFVTAQCEVHAATLEKPAAACTAAQMQDEGKTSDVQDSYQRIPRDNKRPHCNSGPLPDKYNVLNQAFEAAPS